MFGVYKITNLINNKCYIGKSESLTIEYRLEQHKNGVHSNKYLQNSIKKYGIDNFKFEILEECNPEDCCDREIYWIKKLNSMYPNGYNLTSGGERKGGFKFSEEIRTRISISQMKKYRGDNFRRYHDNKDKIGIKRKDKDKLKISEGVKRQWSDPDKRAKLIKGLSENRKGKIMINNGEYAKLIYPSEKDSYKGWKLGSLKGNKKIKFQEIIE